MTIDELAREAGVSVRTIRDHQTRGLLAPPRVRGRTGYYDADHLARLKLIREMQLDGFNLRAIKRVLERSDVGSGEILDFRQTLRAPFEHEQPIVMTADEIVEAFGERNEAAFAEAERLGVIIPLPDGRYEIPSPAVIRAGAATVAVGVPLEAALELIARLKRNADSSAKAFVDLFIEHVWRPYDHAGQPEEEWQMLQDALTQLRPLAAETLLGMFGPAMSDAVERALQRETRREAQS